MPRLVRWESRVNRHEIDDAIRADYPVSGPIPVAERFGLTKGVISKRAWQLGVKCTTFVARRKQTLADRNTSVDPGYFERWSPNMAWLLGYTWTDGAVSNTKGSHKIHYRCQITDEHIIHDIKAELKSTAQIQRFKPSLTGDGKYLGKPQVGVSISSANAVRTLIETHGIIPNKSNLDPPMPNIPDEYLCHFARGVLDGDGSICRSAGRSGTVIFYGSHQFIESLRNRVSEVAGVRLPTRNKVGSSVKLSRIEWSRSCEVRQLIRWMYPPGEYLALGRKRAKAAEIVGLELLVDLQVG